MITVDCEQGTPEWYSSRAEIPTASNFGRLITPTGKPSTQADAYLNELLGEYATGTTDEESYSGFWMERGKELEPEARLAYQIVTGHKVTQTGFVYKDDNRLVGCSPDGLVMDIERGCEIKCPMEKHWAAYYIANECPKDYRAQVQGSMWITGFEAWDFVAYHPNYEPFIVTVKRDKTFQKAIDEIVPSFIERLLKGRQSERVLELIEMRGQK